jgi:hypothetical protein
VFLYAMGPIHDFTPFLSAEDYYARVRQQLGMPDGQVEAERTYVDRCVAVLATNTYYSAEDHAAGPFVCALPTGGDRSRIAVLVRGRSQGSCYLASPIELAWLSDHFVNEVDAPEESDWAGDAW